jgi:hypothetical protein
LEDGAVKATYNSGARAFIAAATLGLALVVGTASIASAKANVTMSTEQQAQVSALADKLLTIIKSLGPNASEGAIEGALVDAVQGQSPAVIAAAMAQIANTPGLGVSAQAAARRLAHSYAQGTGGTQGTGAVGYSGGVPGSNGPGFASGGGGGTSSNYTH